MLSVCVILPLFCSRAQSYMIDLRSLPYADRHLPWSRSKGETMSICELRRRTSVQLIDRLSRRQALKFGGSATMMASGLMMATKSIATAQEATPVATPAECSELTLDEQKELAKQFFTAWAAHDMSLLADLLAPDYLHHWGIGNDTTGSDVMVAATSSFVQSFSDITFELGPIVAEGDLVAVHWTQTSTQTQPFQGIAASNVPVTYGGFVLFRIACGKLAEGWSEADHLGRLQRNGVITPDELETVGTPTP